MLHVLLSRQKSRFNSFRVKLSSAVKIPSPEENR